jgi:Flp pilus assembly protein TadG
MINCRRSHKECGVSLVLGILALLFIIPMVGLSIDVALVYAIKARLQASVDGAALAAARALSLGATTSAQATSAQQNAVNWFYANFPSGNWTTSGTVMTATNVTVANDPNNNSLRDITVAATTNAPTYFMKWFGVNSVSVAASGTASRKDVVIMMVLDRSGSMCKPGSSPCTATTAGSACQAMVTAAKTFTGMFAAGRDRIGLVSFAEATYVHSVPSTNFQTTLGYTNDSGSGTGALDNIACGGGTGTAEGIAMAYQLLYQTNLPGAMNVILLETDGLPNTLSMNFWDPVNNVAGLSSSSSCTDVNGKKMSNGGFASLSVLPAWAPGITMNAAPFLTTSSYLSNISGTHNLVGAVASTDPDGGDMYWNMINYWTSFTANTQSTGNSSYPFNALTGTGSPSLMGNSTAPGCSFDGTGGYYVGSPSDIAWWPATDAFGNSLNPSGYSYLTVSTDAHGHILQSNWTNYHNAVMNATDNSAYLARTNATLPAAVYAIGLGGNSSTGPPDPVLLQRMANDPNGDLYNSPATYVACASATNCQTFSSQPQGTFVYAPTATNLGQAFQSIASQVLRLSK